MSRSSLLPEQQLSAQSQTVNGVARFIFVGFGYLIAYFGIKTWTGKDKAFRRSFSGYGCGVLFALGVSPGFSADQQRRLFLALPQYLIGYFKVAGFNSGSLLALASLTLWGSLLTALARGIRLPSR